MKSVTITINARTMETFGTGTLKGMVINALGKDKFDDLEQVKIDFEQTSLAWRREHGGPENWIMPEFAIPCLLEDMLDLRDVYGLKVTVSTITPSSHFGR